MKAEQKELQIIELMARNEEIEMDLRREKMFHENAKKYVKHLIETIERYKIECSIRNMELDQNGFLVPIKKEIKQ